MAKKIATGDSLNSLVNYAYLSNTKKCLTKSAVRDDLFVLSGDYLDNQLVASADCSVNLDNTFIG
jgi:hypothetical protein